MNGLHLDSKHLSAHPSDSTWSTYTFHLVRLQPKHFCLWRLALKQLALGDRGVQCLGKFTSTWHKCWEWRYNPWLDLLLHTVNQTSTVYQRAHGPQRSRHSIYVPTAQAAPDPSSMQTFDWLNPSPPILTSSSHTSHLCHAEPPLPPSSTSSMTGVTLGFERISHSAAVAPGSTQHSAMEL